MAKTPEERRQYMREWRRRNPERTHAHNERHKPPPRSTLSETEVEHVRARSREYYQRRKDHICAYHREYRKKQLNRLRELFEQEQEQCAILRTVNSPLKQDN